jgi:hypothetical protein
MGSRTVDVPWNFVKDNRGRISTQWVQHAQAHLQIKCTRQSIILFAELMRWHPQGANISPEIAVRILCFWYPKQSSSSFPRRATTRPRRGHEEATRRPRGGHDEATTRPRRGHDEATRRPRQAPLSSFRMRVPKVMEYFCTSCAWPPCKDGCGTPRPRSSKYHIRRMPSWRCPKCRPV